VASLPSPHRHPSRHMWNLTLTLTLTMILPLGLALTLTPTLPLTLTLTFQPEVRLSAAWEVTPADQTQYWEQVPDNVKLTLHYYNVPCSIEPDSEFNPLRIVKTLYQPGDFVVIKVGAHTHTMPQGFAAVVVAVCTPARPRCSNFFAVVISTSHDVSALTRCCSS